MATEIEWAWFAGVFEGEGSVAFTGTNTVRLIVKMTDRDVLMRLQKIAGGVVYPRKRLDMPAHYKDQWDWYIDRSDLVLETMGRIKPYLGIRRLQRFEEAEERLRNVRRNGYCKNGHKLDEGHLYVGPKGQRRCKTCANERARQYHQDHKEDRNAKQRERNQRC